MSDTEFDPAALFNHIMSDPEFQREIGRMSEIPTYWLISYTWKEGNHTPFPGTTFWQGALVDWIIQCAEREKTEYHLVFAIEISELEYDRGKDAL